MTDLERCRAEQKACAEQLLAHGHDRGAALGLADWLMEEVFILTDENKK